MSARLPSATPLLALLALLAGCGPLHDDGCFIGPCTVAVGPFPMQLVMVSTARTSGGDLLLSTGDTLRLTVVHVMSSGPLCTPVDTVRDSVHWGLTDSTVATIDARGLLRALTPGAVSVRLLVGGTQPVTSALPLQYLLACPGGGLYGGIVVSP